jgi:hypothetical protein
MSQCIQRNGLRETNPWPAMKAALETLGIPTWHWVRISCKLTLREALSNHTERRLGDHEREYSMLYLFRWTDSYSKFVILVTTFQCRNLE